MAAKKFPVMGLLRDKPLPRSSLKYEGIILETNCCRVPSLRFGIPGQAKLFKLVKSQMFKGSTK